MHNGYLCAKRLFTGHVPSNVLYYGNGCQGPNSLFHGYLKTIIGYTNPDIISLEKMASIPLSADDKYGTAPVGFADSIVTFALNAAFPGRYAYCPFTNNARSNNQATLFFDQRKLGFISIVSSYANITDFNTYKLYYKDPNLERTHDTTFLYVTPNHDKSGDEHMMIRGNQIAEEMGLFKKHFTHLPNLIDLGDFNVRNSNEPCYKTLTASGDSNFLFYDPPFYPDRDISYPADWDHNGQYAAYLTTATREAETSCGSGGGAKGWYDHIFLSPWIVNNVDYSPGYIPHSYRTIGNDGKRFGISINDSKIMANTSAPPDVIEALYHMSNKYPVMVSLEVTSNINGTSPPDPDIATTQIFVKEEVTVTDPVKEEMMLHFPESMIGQDVTIECFDIKGISQMKKKIKVKETELSIKCKLEAGAYKLKCSTEHNLVSETGFTKQ